MDSTCCKVCKSVSILDVSIKELVSLSSRTIDHCLGGWSLSPQTKPSSRAKCANKVWVLSLLDIENLDRLILQQLSSLFQSISCLGACRVVFKQEQAELTITRISIGSEVLGMSSTASSVTLALTNTLSSFC